MAGLELQSFTFEAEPQGVSLETMWFANPSLYEGFGLPPLEAMSAASSRGIELLVLPECFIGGYPYWRGHVSVKQGTELGARLCESAIRASGPEVAAIEYMWFGNDGPCALAKNLSPSTYDEAHDQ